MKKFLLITYAFPPMGLVGAIRPYKLCRYLPSKGWVPEVITVNPRKGLHLDFTLLENIPEAVIVHRTKTFDPVLIYRQYRKETKGKGKNDTKLNAGKNKNDLKYNNKYIINMIELIKNIFLNALSTPDHQVFWNIFIFITGIRILLKEKNIQFIMTSSPPHSSQIAGMILSILFRKPYIVDYRDPWNDIFVIKKGYIRSKIEILLESCIIKRANYVISTSETYANVLKKRYIRYNEGGKYVYITNSFEKELFLSINSVSSPIFTISYLGIFYPQYNPYYFFKVLSVYLNQYNIGKGKISLKIIGNIDKNTNDILYKYNLLEILDITGRVNHEEAIKIAKSSDLLLLLMGTTELTPKGWIPSKLIEYIACGKPILGIVPEGEAAKIIRNTNTGYVITTEDEESIITILKKEHERKMNGEIYINNSESKEIDKYSNDYQTTKFIELFNLMSNYK